MSTIKRHRFALAAAVAAVALALAGWQISGGNVGAQTYAVQVFASQTGTGPSAPVKNIGASSHWLSYCTTNSSGIEIELEGSNDGLNWFQISNLGNVTGCAVITASGYYQNVRADILEDTSSGGTASVTAYYTASTFPISNTGVLDVGIQARPVVPVAATPYQALNVLSTFQQVLGAPAVVTDFYVYNPNTTPVFAYLKDNTLAVPLIREIPATSGLEVSNSSGFFFPNVVTVACSTSISLMADPTLGCYMSLGIRSATFVNTLVNSSGAVQQRQQTGGH